MDSKSSAISIDPNASLSKSQCPTTDEIATMWCMPYQKAIGSLMYVAVGIQPNIVFAISTLSQYLKNPGQAHWEAAIHVFHYLQGTKNLRLTFGGTRQELEGYSDAGGASQEYRCAISGYAFLINGSAISWSSQKQELVILSTAEAKYITTTHAAEEAIWLWRFIGEVFSSLTSPTTLHCDNQSAIAIATNGNFHVRMKHIDICYHFI